MTKEGLLNLLERVKEVVERGSEFGLVRYETQGEEYIVHAQVSGFDENMPTELVKIAAL